MKNHKLPYVNRMLFIISLSILGLSLAILHTKNTKLSQLKYGHDFNSINISNEFSLTPSNDTIKFASMLYGVKKPRNVLDPVVNMEIADRGLTYGSGFANEKFVEIGPPAFISWSVLASTLGHEIEIHCNQSFTMIWLSELFHFHGTVHAEREAYEYEEDNHSRFGLTKQELSQINHTKEYFYPVETKSSKPVNAIDQFLKKYLLSSK